MLQQVALFLFDSGRMFFNSLMTSWDIIGYFIVASFVLIRVVNFIKRFFK